MTIDRHEVEMLKSALLGAAKAWAGSDNKKGCPDAAIASKFESLSFRLEPCRIATIAQDDVALLRAVAYDTRDEQILRKLKVFDAGSWRH